MIRRYPGSCRDLRMKISSTSATSTSSSELVVSSSPPSSTTVSSSQRTQSLQDYQYFRHSFSVRRKDNLSRRSLYPEVSATAETETVANAIDVQEINTASTATPSSSSTENENGFVDEEQAEASFSSPGVFHIRKNKTTTSSCHLSLSSFASAGTIEEALMNLESAFDDDLDDADDQSDNDSVHHQSSHQVAFEPFFPNPTPPPDSAKSAALMKPSCSSSSSRQLVRFQDENLAKQHKGFSSQGRNSILSSASSISSEPVPMFDYPQHCHQNHHQKYFLGDNSNRGQQHVTSSTGEYRQYPPPTASATTAFPDNSMSHSYNDELQRIQREQDDLAFAKNLQQQQEEKGCDVYEEAVARIHDVPTEREQLVQMLLTVATKEAEQRRLNREQQRNVVRARVVEYVAPDEIPEKRPAFSLVPDILFEEEEGSDKKDVCAICYEALSSGTAVALTVCGHTFHLDCIDDLLEHHKSKHCPQCRKSVRQEPQGVSPSGSMSITKPTIDKVSDRYPPHTDGSSNKRVIQMDYKIPDGFQKVFHDRPGERFRGCTKVAYLPDSMEGRALLERLIYAFSHGLTFKVTKDPNNPDEKDHVDWGTVPHTTTVMDEKDDMQYLYYVACHEELDQLGVPR